MKRMKEMTKFANFSRVLSEHSYSVPIPCAGPGDWWGNECLLEDACSYYRAGKYSVIISDTPEYKNVFDVWAEIDTAYREDILND